MTHPVIELPGTLNAATAARLYALEVLRRNGGDRAATAKALDVAPETLRIWMAQLRAQGLEIPRVKRVRPNVFVPRGPLRIVIPAAGSNP